jgi:hypothetical protein
MATLSPDNPLDRWPLGRLTLDANGDGHVDAADVLANAGSLFFLPGDSCLFALATYAAPLARWLDLGSADYGGVVSAVLSACAWFIAFTIVSIVYHRVLDVDRRLTGAVRGLLASVARHARMARALWRQRWRAWLASHRQAKPEAPSREVALSATERKVLMLHAGLAAGYALSVSEVADALGARRDPTRELLTALKELGFLNRSIGGADDETSYTLSTAGRAWLAAHGSRRRTATPSHS